MRPEEVFKRYDIRGKYPEEIDEEFAELLGKALGSFALRNFKGRVTVCQDNKESSKGLKDALIRGLISSGSDVIDVDVGPTDYAAFCGNHLDTVSVQVTSSHMPLSFNGFKFMYPEGNGFVNRDLYTVQDIFRDRDFEEGHGKIEERNMLDLYENELKETALKYGENWDKKVVTDSLGGTARILPEMLRELGAEVIDLAEDTEGLYQDPPYPKPENLGRLQASVEENSADLGIANDLDSDRITVYYEGRFLTGDELFCILSQLVNGPVVASIDTSKALETFSEVEYTRVGDPFVMERALEIDAELAGEPNGHYSITDFVPYNSGILTALIVSGLEIDEILEKIPDYAVKRASVEVEDKEKTVEYLKQSLDEDDIISDLDGVKFCKNGAEVLARPSGSSQKVRVISEASSAESALEALESVRNELESFQAERLNQ